MSTNIDVKLELSKLQSMYKDNPRRNKLHALILGEKGAGKTHIIKTCPKPILIHSFDPGGTETLKDEIDKGDIIVDTRYETDDPYNPTAALDWRNEFNRLGNANFFEGIGTYVIDPLTTMSMCIVWQIMRKQGRTPPELDRKMFDDKHGMRKQDWMTKLEVMVTITRQLGNLPCHTIVTCHYNKTIDEIGRQMINVQLPGKSAQQVPVLIPEMYVLQVDTDGRRKLLTQNDGLYRASTRMGRNGIFSKYEEPDIRALLKKAGYPYEDKEV